MDTYIPVWNRGKNKLIGYEPRQFHDGVGNHALVHWAIYLDKHNEQQEMVAWVRWK